MQGGKDVRFDYLVELVAKICGVDVVAFEVREHDDLRWVSGHAVVERFATHKKDHRKEQSCGHKDQEEEQLKNWSWSQRTVHQVRPCRVNGAEWAHKMSACRHKKKDCRVHRGGRVSVDLIVDIHSQ